MRAIIRKLSHLETLISDAVVRDASFLPSVNSVYLCFFFLLFGMSENVTPIFKSYICGSPDDIA